MGAARGPGTPGRERGPRRGLRAAAAGCAALLVAAGGYTAAVGTAELPAPVVRADAAADEAVTADPGPAQAIADAEALPTAVGWLEGDGVWANTDEAAPLASITKLVTALVGLERQPLAPGEEGPVHVWSEADRARQETVLAQDGVAFPIPVGTEVTARQMLTLALVPSANDFAAAYADAVFGGPDAFAAAAADWAQRHGLRSLVIVEPTGLDERNAASPADVVRLARLALDEPVVAELVALPAAELPWGIGRVPSTNPLFGVLPDVRGLKTGRTTAAGYNLVAARTTDAGGRDLVQLAAVLGRPTEEARLASAVAALRGLDGLPRRVELVAAGERVGTAVAVDGARVPLVAGADAWATLAPGESTARRVRLGALDPGPIRAGREAGAILVDSPAGREEVPVVVGGDVAEPDLWWRLAHPGAILAPG